MSFENGQEYSALFELSEGEFSLLATVVTDNSIDFSATYELSEGEFPLLGTVNYTDTKEYSATYELSEGEFALLSINQIFDDAQHFSTYTLPPYIGDDTQIITYSSHKPETYILTGSITLPEFSINGSITINNPIETTELKTETIQDYAYDLSKKTKTKGEVLNEDAINLSIENILSTLRGERLFSPFFGSKLQVQIFESIDIFTARNLLDELLYIIDLWEDRITVIVHQVELDVLTEKNQLNIVIPYIIKRNGLTGTFARKIIL